MYYIVIQLSRINSKNNFMKFDDILRTTLSFYFQELNLYSLSPISDSAPSITEEYSITAALQRNGVTNEIVKKWAAEILTAVDVLHRNGVICR